MTEETFQVSAEQAEVYESTFVPALFAEWAPRLVDAVGVKRGQRVLDVACGTGVVARTVADRLGGSGSVVGVDINEGMLAVARRVRPELEWRHGDAADLPFPDGSFDVVLCQAALMFFPDPVRALREMARVLEPGGTLGLQVWGSLETQAGYGPLVEVAARHAGPEAVDLLGSYWVLGDLALLGELLAAAGLRVSDTRTRTGTARFLSIEAVVRTEVEGTPLIDRISEETYRKILADAEEALRPFTTPKGAANLPMTGHLVVATRVPSDRGGGWERRGR